VVTETVLELQGLSKTFGATRALANVDFDVRAGEVHGLVGRNGSGKSTLIKVLSGYHVPDPGGHLIIGGEVVPLPVTGRAAAEHGLVFVHQDLGLVGAYSVLENIRLNSWASSGLQPIHWKTERASVAEELARFGLFADPATPIDSLSQVDRAIVAIVRAMHHLGVTGDGTGDSTGKVLVLDEPTAYLPTDSVERLFDAVRAVAATGAGVVFVSHRTDEVLNITDRITVLRDGELVETVVTDDTDEDALVALILGRALDSFYPDPIQTEPGERVLTVEGLTGGLVKNLYLEVDRGEIIGLTGLMGAGHDEVPYYIFGARDAQAGHITVNGQGLPIAKSTPTDAIAAGVALLPADRLNLSGSAAASVEDNVALPVLKKYFSRGRLQLAAVRSQVGGLMTSFDVRPAMPTLNSARYLEETSKKRCSPSGYKWSPHCCCCTNPPRVSMWAVRQIFSFALPRLPRRVPPWLSPVLNTKTWLTSARAFSSSTTDGSWVNSPPMNLPRSAFWRCATAVGAIALHQSRRNASSVGAPTGWVTTARTTQNRASRLWSHHK